MLLLNIIVVLIVLAYQVYNITSLTKTLREKTKYMNLRLINNEFVLRTVKPYKMKLLMYNRILLLVTVVLSPLLIIFNKSNIILIAFLLIFGVLVFILNHYYIGKTYKEINSLEIVEADQDFEIKYFGLFVNDKEGDHIYQYGGNRFAINIATFPGKGIVAGIVLVFIAFIIVIGMYGNPAKADEEIKSSLSTSELVLSYKDQKVNIPLDTITSIKKEEEAPNITSKVEGYQENGNDVGIFNLQGIPNAYLFVEKKTPTYLVIVANKKYYYFSDDDQANSNTIFSTISKNVESKKKAEK